MENLIWLVVIGGLFLSMMRKGGGYCGSHSHGGHEKHGEQEHAPAGENKNEKKAGYH